MCVRVLHRMSFVFRANWRTRRRRHLSVSLSRDLLSFFSFSFLLQPCLVLPCVALRWCDNNLDTLSTSSLTQSDKLKYNNNTRESNRKREKKKTFFFFACWSGSIPFGPVFVSSLIHSLERERETNDLFVVLLLSLSSSSSSSCYQFGQRFITPRCVVCVCCVEC